MKKIKPKDLTPIAGSTLMDISFKFLSNFARFKKINQLYKAHSQKEALTFVNDILKELSLEIEVDPKQLKNIPKKGPFIVVSNFPLGGIDGLLLIKLISEIRPDFKLIVSPNYHKIKPLDEVTLPLPEPRSSIYTLAYLKDIFTHLRNGGGVGVFPALLPAKYNPRMKVVIDRKWNTDIIRLIKAAKVPVVPLFIQNKNSMLFHVLGLLHPLFQASRLEKEMKKKKNQKIQIKIGKPVQPESLQKFDVYRTSKYLRSRVYALGMNVEVNKFFGKKGKNKIEQAVPVIDPVDPKIIEKQINEAKKEYLEFSVNEMDVIVAPTYAIPDILTEIGRLREITFRSIGEGTNKSIDLDEYDLYYHHLIIWDRKNKKIVGAYRLGLGDEIMERFGPEGFYTSTLFKYKKEFYPILQQGVELGRSFVVPEYQRKPLSLFLLWKGIVYFLLKHNQYRYLIGPVTMSDKFSDLGKNLIVSFFEKFYSDPELKKYVKPRMPYKSKLKTVDKDVLLQDIGNDINKLDNYLKEVENGLRLPVLYKKYMSLGAKVLVFNVDPDFNYCVDGLMVLDMYDVPIDMLKSLAKELDADTLIERFISN